MSTQNKHTAKAIGLSLLITIFAYFNMDSPKPYPAIYILFVSVASFISIYLISMITAKAYLNFIKHIGCD
ncbi:hypothetical protein P2R12_07770 [Cytobacillus oceanisediminis]|uniref:hypothetical protein n=1 Tax=Cytobacillus oceanisediminis TaxID=665099 RepID=UPI0023DAE1A1|nr:hypothetical protein [Cytobacillus oceanisediminis]MDF2036870.1 hypothetical protein [Cytobacillus oceanisediminis]